MKIIIVEDNNDKFGKIFNALSLDGVKREDVVHTVCAADAVEALSRSKFDIMLLDVNIPRRLGEATRRGGGLEVLSALDRNTELYRPTYVVGITAFEDVFEEFGEAFADSLWSLIWYSETSDRWISQLRTKLGYIRALRRSLNFSDGVTYGVDFAVVCALPEPELAAVRALELDWQPLRLAHDETRYHSGTFTHKGENVSVIAAAAPRMGMPASAVLASKMIHQFRPRFLVMLGICAGRASKVNIGDLIIADPTWDWGSGKFVTGSGDAKFLPLPHQLDLDVDVGGVLKELCEDQSRLDAIRNAAHGKKPSDALKAHMGPLASGAAVVANASIFEGLVEPNRGLLGIDMEAYGVATAALGNGKPRPQFMIVKAVCDFADDSKNDDYQQYAASVSALFFLEAAKSIRSLS